MQLFYTAAGERVSVGLDVIWLDLMSRRPLPLEDGETTISRLCLIAERLTNPLHNHSVEAFRQIDDLMESVTDGKTLYLIVDLKCEADLPEGASCAAILTAARAVSNLDVLGRASSRQHGRPASIAAVIANYPFILGCFGKVFPRFLVGPVSSAGGYLPLHPRERRRRSLSEDMIHPFCNPSRKPRLKRHSLGR